MCVVFILADTCPTSPSDQIIPIFDCWKRVAAHHAYPGSIQVKLYSRIKAQVAPPELTIVPARACRGGN